MIGDRISQKLGDCDTALLVKIQKKVNSMTTKQLTHCLLCDIRPTKFKRLGNRIPVNTHAAARRTNTSSKARTAIAAGRPRKIPLKTVPEKISRKHSLAAAVLKNQSNWKKH